MKDIRRKLVVKKFYFQSFRRRRNVSSVKLNHTRNKIMNKRNCFFVGADFVDLVSGSRDNSLFQAVSRERTKFTTTASPSAQPPYPQPPLSYQERQIGLVVWYWHPASQ